MRSEKIYASNGRKIGVRLVLALKPTKTDPTGEKGWEKSFVVDDSSTSLSAGAAIFSMLSGEPLQVSVTGSALSHTPLFLDPATGLELKYDFACAELQDLLCRAGFPELASGLHSLRVGGATAAANDPSGGGLCPAVWAFG